MVQNSKVIKSAPWHEFGTLLAPKALTCSPDSMIMSSLFLHRLNPWIALTIASACLVLLPACNGSKAFVKRAMNMEEVGMMEQAASFYQMAVSKNPNNTDALAGLQRSGQWVLNQYLEEFDQARLAQDRGRAVSAYETAEDYYQKIERYGIRLLFLESAQAAYVLVKNAHLDDLYEQGITALEEARFQKAQEAFDEIGTLDPNYKDAAALGLIAYCEPRYLSGVQSMDDKKWRNAHDQLKAVVDRDAQYKDAQTLLNEALEKGRFAIALVGFENGSDRAGMDTKFRSYVQQALLESSDPFLMLVDRENQDLMLQEQQMALSGMVDGSSAVGVGSIQGAKAILRGTVVSCDIQTSSLQKQDKAGFESYQVEKVNEDGKKVYETKFRPVIYQEYSRSRTASVTFQVSLVSLETGTTECSEMIFKSETDYIDYIRFNGNVKNLFPASISGNVNRSGKNGLISKMQARSELIAESILIDNATRASSSDVRRIIENKLKVLIP